jgi:hypothetical protein
MVLLLLFVAWIAIISVYININLFKKIEKYEEEIEFYQNFTSEKAMVYKKLLEKMRQIDQLQMFEKDDDVGSIFNGIKTLIEDYEDVS